MRYVQIGAEQGAAIAICLASKRARRHLSRRCERCNFYNALPVR